MTADQSRRGRITLAAVAVLSVVGAAAGLLGLDGEVATASLNAPVLGQLVTFLDFVTGKALFDLLLPLGLLAAGAIAALARRPAVGRVLLYVGAVQLAYLIADLSKPHFGRLRPYEPGAAADVWFAASGNSFPSGHAAFYAGLILPLLLLFPRWWPLIIVPTLVAAQRVLSDDHYLSDVSVSVLIAALAALLLRPIAPRAAGRERVAG